MTTSEIWLTPDGAPPLIMDGNKPRTSSKRDWYEQSFPSATFVRSVMTTRDYLGNGKTWAYSADGWGDTGNADSGLQTPFKDRSKVGTSLKRESFQTVSLGPVGSMSNDNASGNWSRDVVGVSFVYDRQDCYWKEADIEISQVGIRYWNIKTQRETVELSTLKESGGNYPPNQASVNGNRDAPPALAVYKISSGAKEYYKGQNVICIGVYFQYHVYTPGNYGAASHTHRIGICELAPVHRNDEVKCRPIATAGNWSPNDKHIRIT